MNFQVGGSASRRASGCFALSFFIVFLGILAAESSFACHCEPIEPMIRSVRVRLDNAKNRYHNMKQDISDFSSEMTSAPDIVRKCEVAKKYGHEKKFDVESALARLGNPAGDLEETLNSCMPVLEETCKPPADLPEAEKNELARIYLRKIEGYKTALADAKRDADEINRLAGELREGATSARSQVVAVQRMASESRGGGTSCERPSDPKVRKERQLAREQQREKSIAEANARYGLADSTALPPKAAPAVGAAPGAPKGAKVGEASVPAPVAGATGPYKPDDRAAGRPGSRPIDTADKSIAPGRPTDSGPVAGREKSRDESVPVAALPPGDKGTIKTGDRPIDKATGTIKPSDSPGTTATTGTAVGSTPTTPVGAAPGSVTKPSDVGSPNPQGAKPFGVDTSSPIESSSAKGSSGSGGGSRFQKVVGAVSGAIQTVASVMGLSDQPSANSNSISGNSAAMNNATSTNIIAGTVESGGAAVVREPIRQVTEPNKGGAAEHGGPNKKSPAQNGIDPARVTEQSIAVSNAAANPKKTNYIVYSSEGNLPAGGGGAVPTGSPAGAASSGPPTGGGSAAELLAAGAGSAEAHPCDDLNSLQCAQWKCERGMGTCPDKDALAKAKASAKAPKAITQIYEGEESGGSGGPKSAASSLEETLARHLNSIKGPSVLAKKEEDKNGKPVGEAKNAVSKQESRLDPKLSPVRGPASASESLVTTGALEEKNDRRMEAPKWFKYLPKFLLDSSLLNAFFRTKGGRYISGERVEIAHAHGDLFGNVNRAYASHGQTLAK